MKKIFRNIFKKRIMIPLILLGFISISIYYLGNSKEPLNDSYSTINIDLFNDEIMDELRTNFLGSNYEFSLNEQQINDYVNSYFQNMMKSNGYNIIGGKGLSLEADISLLSRKIQLNVDYLFISTTIFCNFDVVQNEDNISIEFSNFELGNNRLNVADFISNGIIRRFAPTTFEKPDFINLNAIVFTEEKLGIDISLDYSYLRKVYSEYSQNLDPEILKENFVGSEQEEYDYIIRFFSNSVLTEDEINAMTMRLLWDGKYFKVMSLIKKDEVPMYDNFINEVSQFSKKIDPEQFDRDKIRYKKTLTDLKETHVLKNLSSVDDLFAIIYGSIHETPSNDYASLNGHLYLLDTKEVININLLSRKGLIDIDDYQNWDIFCKGNQVLIGCDTEIGYVLYFDMNSFKIFDSKKEVLIYVGYELKSYQKIGHENISENDKLLAAILNYENINDVFLRSVSIRSDQAYVIASPMSSQVVNQYILKNDGAWRVVESYRQDQGVRQDIYNVFPEFDLRLLPSQEISNHEMAFLSDGEISALEKEMRLNGILDDFTNINHITQIDNLVYFRTSESEDFVRRVELIEGKDNISYIDISNKSYEIIAESYGLELPIFTIIIR